MRITFALQGDRTISSLNQRQEEVTKLANQISTGVKMSTPSDDPTAWAKSMIFKQGIREYDAIQNNITFATGWNQASDSAINTLTDLVSEARQIGISAVSASASESANASEIKLDQIIQQAVDAGNSQYGDQYVFSGSKTNTAPFTFDDTTGTLTYHGDTTQITVRTDKGNTSSFVVNTDGNTLMDFASGNNVVSEIYNLKQAIAAGNTDDINTCLDNLEDAYTYIANQGSVTGNRLSALDNITSTLSVFKTNAKSDLSDVEDTDVAEALTNVQQSRTAYQAALQVTSILSSLNLMNYLSS